jgi:hypothetical protein
MHRFAGRLLEHRLKSTGHFPVAIDRDEVYAVESLRISKLFDEVARNRHPGASVDIKSSDDWFGYGQLRHLG